MNKLLVALFAILISLSALAQKDSGSQKSPIINVSSYNLAYESPEQVISVVLPSKTAYQHEISFDLSTVSGRRYIRVNQKMDDKEVIGSEIILHLQDGIVTAFRDNSPVDNGWHSTNSSFDRTFYEDKSRMILKLQKLTDESQSLEILDEGIKYFNNDGQLQSVRVVMASQMVPLSRYRLIFHAGNTDLLRLENLIVSCTETGEAHTVYSGIRTIRTNNNGSDFDLNDCFHGAGTRTVEQIGTTLQDYHDDDNIWNDYSGGNALDQYALDAHWATEETYRYFMQEYGLDIFFGELFTSIMNPGLVSNAMYDEAANSAIYGIHNGQYISSPDIVGHEMAHGLTAHTADLAYVADESGAINEAMSDIFGVLLQNHMTGNLNWTLGEGALLVRSLEDPNAHANPDTYEGLHWYYGSDIGAYTHINCGVVNYWFYVLVNGAFGTNDNGDYYDVDGIGLNNASDFVFELLVGFMSENTNMHEMRALSIDLAAVMFGTCSPEYISVVNAWYTVGVGPEYGGYNQIDGLETLEITNCSALLTWDDVSMPEYLVRWREVGQTTWNDVLVFTNELHLMDLDPLTDYEWRVTPACNDQIGSNLSNIEQFTTTSTCEDVSSFQVTDITYCSATITWNDVNASGYSFRYLGPSGTQIIQTTTNSVTLNNLEPNTTYIMGISTNCGNCSSPGVDLGAFTTQVCALPNPINVSIGACKATLVWQFIENQEYEVEYRFGASGPWFSTTPFMSTVTFGHNQPAGATIQFRLTVTCLGDGCSQTIVSPVYEGTVPEPSSECGDPSNFTAEIFEDPSGAFTTVTVNWLPSPQANWYHYERAFDPAGPYTQFQTGTPSVTNWLVGSGVNCVYLRVRASCGCDQSNITFSDWVEFEYCEDCEPPTNIQLEWTCQNFARLTYDPGSSFSSEVRYRPTSSSTWIPLPFLTFSVSPEFFLSMLAPETEYEVQLRALCSDGTGEWTDSFVFTTAGPCLAPTDLFTQQVSSNQVMLGWTSPTVPVEHFIVAYRATTDLTWTEIPVTSNSATIGGLDLDNEVYQFRVKTQCNHCEESTWSNIIEFPSCLDGFYIGPDAGTMVCDPCQNDCYVCIFDESGTALSATGLWYEIEWTLPAGYPQTSSQLVNNECIPMSPTEQGELFLADIGIFESINGVKTLVCRATLSYVHDCGNRPRSAVDSNSGTSIPFIRIYPVPTSNELFIDGVSIGTYEIRSLTGRILKTGPLDEDGITPVNLIARNSGIYICTVYDASGHILLNQKMAIMR